MTRFILICFGGAVGTGARYLLGGFVARVAGPDFPYSTLLINVLGSFVIGYFGTLTLQSGKYPASDNLRLFVMVGICGGFTTFSSFSLQTFDLMRSGGWGRALANVVLSVVLCVAAVAAGHRLAQQTVNQAAIAETAEEEYTG